MPQVDLKKIRQLRIQQGVTQEEMSKYLGYKTEIGYHYLEKGRCKIRAEHLAAIAQKLGVSLDCLYVTLEN